MTIAPMAGSVLDAQMEQLRRAYPNASMNLVDGGLALVTVPGVELPEGWSQKVTTVWFHAPVGYPMAKPDCFWADSTLRLAGGGMPQSSGINAPAGYAQPLTWFSWHVQPWNPVGDTLLTYVRVIRDRFLKRN
jgi:hypothetical protein